MNSSIQEKSVSYVAILLMPREFDALSRVMHLSSKRDLIESTNRKLEMEKNRHISANILLSGV